MAKAGLKAIYLSGWQVAADGNLAGDVYPDQSLYPANSVPAMVRRLDNALLRADRIEWAEGHGGIDYLLPIVADAEAGFGGPLNAFELMKGMIESGARPCTSRTSSRRRRSAAISVARCSFPPASSSGRSRRAPGRGHDGRPDPRRRPHRCRLRHPADERRRRARPRVPHRRALTGGLLLRPLRRRGGDPPRPRLRAVRRPRLDGDLDADLDVAREFAEAIHAEFPGKLLAYNCSPSFNWRRHLDDETIERFQRELGAMGYKFQFITLAGFHALTSRCSSSRAATRPKGCPRMCGCRSGSSRSRTPVHGDEAPARGRRGWFDEIAQAVSGGRSSTLALKGSTEEAQFNGNDDAYH